MMDTISYSKVRENLAQAMTRVCDNHEVIIVTRTQSKPVVMMSLEDYNALEETAYLLSNPANAARLRDSIQQYQQGQCQNRNLIEDD